MREVSWGCDYLIEGEKKRSEIEFILSKSEGGNEKLISKSPSRISYCMER